MSGSPGSPLSASPTKVEEGFAEPNPGFKALLSQWDKMATAQKDKTGQDKSHISSQARRSRAEAKKEHIVRKKSGVIDKASAKKALRQPKNVYQQPLQHKADFKPPEFPKTESEVKLIKSALKKNFVFSDLTSRDLRPLIGAFEMCSFDVNETIIRQGDPGDYFYIIQDGRVTFEVNGTAVGKAGKGNSFGELALLYTCPRAATVVAAKPSTLFRVDQMTFRFILQQQTSQSEKEKTNLLKGVNFLKDLAPSDIKKLSQVMTPRVFKQDELLVRKGDLGDAFYVIQEGKVLVKDISVGTTVYADQTLGAGEYFGERSLVTSEPRAANVVGLTTGVAFSIDRKTFETVLGSMSHLIMKAQDVRRLAGVTILQNANLDGKQMAALAQMITDRSFAPGSKIAVKDQGTEAAFYFVREGEVIIEGDSGSETVSAGGYFGQAFVEMSLQKQSTNVISPVDISCSVHCTLGVLCLSDCQSVFDIASLVTEKALEESFSELFIEEPSHESTATLDQLKRHKILGAGTFGQVWLVSEEQKGGNTPYALKIQSKYDLVMEGQAQAVIEEKNIMIKMRHPFILKLVKTFQDSGFVYMLVDLVQGGELFSLIHDVNSEVDGLPEPQAKFYAFGVADALAYMHRSKIVYRDLKPENVMIDSLGYPKVIDFGFAKYVADKTYTLCGTPGYLPPEVVMTRGHDCSADHWSLGILIYEMITGDNPFYFEGMDQMTLFRSIVQDDYEPPPGASEAATDLIAKFLVKDASRRIGSLAKGEQDILQHEWFADLDLKDLRRKEIKAPWVPEIKDPLDTSCFDDWGHLVDKTSEDFPALEEKDAKLFKDF